jgi:hypothetical protein
MAYSPTKPRRSASTGPGLRGAQPRRRGRRPPSATARGAAARPRNGRLGGCQPRSDGPRPRPRRGAATRPGAGGLGMARARGPTTARLPSAGARRPGGAAARPGAGGLGCPSRARGPPAAQSVAPLRGALRSLVRLPVPVRARRAARPWLGATRALSGGAT